jgi:DNA-binding transcriptional regulator YiaG
MSRVQFAKTIGVHWQSVARWEIDMHEPGKLASIMLDKLAYLADKQNAGYP